MATTETKKPESKSSSSNSSNSTRKSSGSRSSGNSNERSAFFGGQSGALLGAAVAGVAVGIAANYGRKFVMQIPSVAGSWDEALKKEHRLTLTLFDQLEATSDDATTTRAGLIKKLKYALTKHAVSEENVIYPALREAGEVVEADELNAEHGYVKNFLYELDNMEKDAPGFLAKVREFRTMIEDHIRTEEDELFPRLKAKLDEEKDKKLTYAMGRENLKMA